MTQNSSNAETETPVEPIEDSIDLNTALMLYKNVTSEVCAIASNMSRNAIARVFCTLVRNLDNGPETFKDADEQKLYNLTKLLERSKEVIRTDLKQKLQEGEIQDDISPELKEKLIKEL